MDFFINNILFIAIFFTVFLSIFLFIKYQKSSNHTIDKKVSSAEIEIRLRAFERITLLLERIKPLNIINRLELHSVNNDQLKVILIKNISIEYDYNVSQQIYVSNELWSLVELIKDRLINSVANISDNLKPDAKTTHFIEQMLKDQRKNNLLIQKAQKILNLEVKSLI